MRSIGVGRVELLKGLPIATSAVDFGYFCARVPVEIFRAGPGYPKCFGNPKLAAVFDHHRHALSGHPRPRCRLAPEGLPQQPGTISLLTVTLTLTVSVSFANCKVPKKYVLPTYLYSLSPRNNLLGRIIIIQSRKSVCRSPEMLQF